jgi:hypothetical protein
VSITGLSPTTAIVAMGTMAVGFAFQAALGIGLALLVVPILALVDPIIDRNRLRWAILGGAANSGAMLVLK